MSRACASGVVFAFCLALGLASCASDPSQGYSFTAARNTGTRTIAVPVFTNDTFSHGMEVKLTEAIVKELQRSSPWRVVSGPSAQTVLTGSITASELKPLSTASGTGLVMEQGVVVSVDFEWRDRASGEVLMARKDFKALESFVPARGTGERLELGQHAAVQELARRIVNELRSSW